MSIGPLMLDLEGLELTFEEQELLRHPKVGGVILFARNFVSAEQLSRLTTAIRDLREPHLLIAVDQEGGRVQRFREDFTRLPPAAWFGEQYRKNAAQARELCELAGWLMAAELRSVGVDFSFAPVLDVDVGLSNVIGDRAFAQKPLPVADLAQAWMRGVHSAGMAVVGKHFPGHGKIQADSHLELPVDQRRLEDLEMEDLIPFERLINGGMEAIMPAHVVYPRIDARPAGFSPFWLKEVLRRRLGFQGVIFSDDLSMEAATAGGGYGERALAALAAGCDMVLACNNRPGALQVLDALQGYEDPVGHLRMLRMHCRGSLSRQEVHEDPRWPRAVQALPDTTMGENLSLPLEA